MHRKHGYSLLQSIRGVLLGGVIALVGSSSFGFSFGSGDGSPGDPYEIENCADIVSIGSSLTASYVMTTNLDCSANGSGIMIGTTGSPFRGDFDGSGHTLTIAINMSGIVSDYIGLFRAINGGEIENLTISGSINAPSSSDVGGIAGYAHTATQLTNITSFVNITGVNYIGSVVGITQNTINTNVNAYATVRGTNYVGGVFGYLSSASFTGGSMSGSVQGNAYVGGLVGYTAGVTLTEGYMVGNVTAATQYAGGLTSYASNSVITNSYFSGSVQGGNSVGGLASILENTDITNAYSIGSVAGATGAGGIAWYMQSSALTNILSVVSVTGVAQTGPFIGNYGNANTVSGSFWNSDVSGVTIGTGGTGMTTAELMDIDTFSGAGRDIEITTGVDLNIGYPYLSWQVDDTSPIWYLFEQPSTNLMMYMNDNGVPGNDNLVHEYRIEFTNTGVPVDDVVIRIEGDIDIGRISVLTGPAISNYVNGSYVERTGISLTGSDYKTYYFTIDHESAGSYVYTATIASVNYDDSNTGNNRFTVTSTVENNATSSGGGKTSTVKKISSPSSSTDNEDDEDEDDSNDADDDEDVHDDEDSDANETNEDDELDTLINDLRDGVEQPVTPSDQMCSDDEYNDAYAFGYVYGLTTMSSCREANMDGTLLRKHAAKMLSNYAMTVLGKEPNTTRACTFSDMRTEDEEMRKYAALACQLGIMGLAADGNTPLTEFNPNGVVDKAQFATMLSRVVYGEMHNGNTACRYCEHVAALQKAGVITVATDLTAALKRAYALIMLMRTNE